MQPETQGSISDVVLSVLQKTLVQSLWNQSGVCPLTLLLGVKYAFLP